jgi:hypothetical protein
MKFDFYRGGCNTVGSFHDKSNSAVESQIFMILILEVDIHEVKFFPRDSTLYCD